MKKKPMAAKPSTKGAIMEYVIAGMVLVTDSRE